MRNFKCHLKLQCIDVRSTGKELKIRIFIQIRILINNNKGRILFSHSTDEEVFFFMVIMSRIFDAANFESMAVCRSQTRDQNIKREKNTEF